MAPPRRRNPVDPDPTEPFLVKLKAYLEDHKGDGVTPASLSLKAELSDSAIRGWLSGKSRSLTIESARKVCRAMGTTLEEFLSSAQTEEERTIVALVSELSEQQRQRLLDYGEGLRDGSRQSRPAGREGS